MTRPPLPPPLKPLPRPGLFRQTPPAIFPPILGLFGLGLAWRRGQGAFGMPGEAVELYLGAVTLLFLFALAAYGAKAARRPGVVAEDFRILPGRAGIAAATMGLMMLAAVLVPYAPSAATGVLVVAVALHTVVALATLRLFLAGPEEVRRVTPVMHLTFVGFIVAPLAAAPLGMTAFSSSVLAYSCAAAAAIWIAALGPLVRGTAPAPLRPLQAIHLAPAALISTAAFLTGYPVAGAVMAGWAGLLFLLLVLRARWLTEAGFSGFWSAFTFPLAAFAGALFLAASAYGSGALALVAGLVLIAATLIIPPIAFKVMQLWARGALAARTNAAVA